MSKRIFDFIVSSMALALLMPIIASCAALIKLTGKGPALFFQERIGFDGKPFRMIKLRTMSEGGKDIAHLTTRNDRRITPIGKLLRKRKLDELPQLINVMKGEMSIVGPRPELRRYVEMFKADYRIVLTVRPGITDYASLRFRNESDMLKSPETYEKDYVGEILPAKIAMYKKYVQARSWSTDLHIIVSTVISLIGK